MLPGLRDTTYTLLIGKGSLHDYERALDQLDYLPEPMSNDIFQRIDLERSVLLAMLSGLHETTNTQLMRRGSLHDYERALDHLDYLPDPMSNDILQRMYLERLQYLSSDLSGSEALNLHPLRSYNRPIEQ